MNTEVTKIYRLETLGYDKIHQELTQLRQDFDAIKKSKIEAEQALSSSKSIELQRQYGDVLNKVRIKEAEITSELKIKTAEAKANLELERIRFNEQKLAAQQEAFSSKQKRANLEYEKGSYKDIIAQQKELRTLLQSISKESGTIINFNGQSINYEEATRQLKALSEAEQNFRRQFTKDNLLVGEYTSGIIKAFHDMGLDDIIGGQITKANEHLKILDQRAEEIKTEIQKVGSTSTESLGKLSSELVENRKEATALKASISSVETEMRSLGNSGSKISQSINQGFKSLKGSLTSLMFQYIGFQAVFAKLQSEISAGLIDAKKIEGVENAFRNLNRPDLLDNLRAATKGTVDDITLMQNAVKAQNFQIPIENLANYFEFARRRAKETGESVDYLVNSIITGIGRKSPLILDNLGISVVALREKMKGISEESATIGDMATAVGQIISEENAKAAKDIDTHSEALAKNEAKWKNIRAELAERLLPTITILSSLILGAISAITSIPFSWWVAGFASLTAIMISNNSQWILQRLEIIRTTIAQNAHTVSTNLLSASKQILSNNLKIVNAGFKTLWTTIRANPITALIVILAGLILWISKIVYQNEAVKKSFDTVKKALEQLINAFSPLITVIGQVISKLTNSLSPAFSSLINSIIIPLINFYLPPLVLGIRLVSGAVSVLVGELAAAIKTGFEFAKATVEIMKGIATLNPSKVIKGAAASIQSLKDFGGDNIKDRIARNWDAGFNGQGAALGSSNIGSSVSPLNTNTVDTNPEPNVDKAKKSQKEIEDARLKEIEDARDRMLAIKETEFLQGKILEEQYLQDILDINNAAIDKKLNIIKKGFTEEAKLNLERLKNNQDTESRLYELSFNKISEKYNKEIALIEYELERQLQREDITETEKANLKIEANNKLIDLHQEHYNKIEQLDRKYNQKTKDNLKKISDDIYRQKRQNYEREKELREAFFRDVDNELSIDKAMHSRRVSVGTIDILSDKNTTDSEKARKINDLEKSARLEELDLEIAALRKKTDEEARLLEQGYTTQKNYDEALAALQAKRLERKRVEYESTRSYLQKMSDSFKDGWNNLVSIFKEGQKASQAQTDAAYEFAINRTKESINSAKELYFKNKNQEVEKEREVALEKIKIQEDQELKYAKNEEDKEAIRIKYDKKRELEEKKAGEKKKKTAIQQATLDFSLAVIKTLASYPFPLSLIPLAGLTAMYAVQRAQIASTQFEKGGEVPSRGGRFGGKPHPQGGTPFVFKGRSFEAEVDELAIIRTKGAPKNKTYTISGTQGQIASALNRIGGGVDFSPGAVQLSGKRFADGGVLGTAYPVPVYRPSSVYSNNMSIDTSGLLNIIDKQNESITKVTGAVVAVSKQVSTLEVVQVTSTVTKSQRKQVKQSQISTL